MTQRRDSRDVHRCGDCGCEEGQLHAPGCDMEPCPFCGHQLLSCACIHERLHLIDPQRYGEETANLPPEVFASGPTPAQERRWWALLERKGRYPYIRYPIFCALCGAPWPEFFRVPDAEWLRYVPASLRREVLCLPCYQGLVERSRAGEPPDTLKAPTLCRRCGALNPEPFQIPDRIWRRYVEPRMQERSLCRACFEVIRQVTDARARK